MIAADLDELYFEHLKIMMQRTDRALADCKFDALVVHSGSPPMQFLDDQTYPYKVNPHFKAWVPITDNPECLLIYAPGQRPKVLFHQPNDYWHKPAALPQERWTAAVELIPLAEPSQGRGPLGGSRAHRLHRPHGCICRHRPRALSTTPSSWFGCITTARSRPPMRSNVCAVQAFGRPRASGSPRRPFAAERRNTRPTCTICRPAPNAKRRCRTTTSSPTTSTLRCCITSTWSVVAPGPAALLSIGCRCPVSRLCRGYHPHLYVGAGALCRC